MVKIPRIHVFRTTTNTGVFDRYDYDSSEVYLIFGDSKKTKISDSRVAYRISVNGDGTVSIYSGNDLIDRFTITK